MNKQIGTFLLTAFIGVALWYIINNEKRKCKENCDDRVSTSVKVAERELESSLHEQYKKIIAIERKDAAREATLKANQKAAIREENLQKQHKIKEEQRIRDSAQMEREIGTAKIDLDNLAEENLALKSLVNDSNSRFDSLEQVFYLEEIRADSLDNELGLQVLKLNERRSHQHGGEPTFVGTGDSFAKNSSYGRRFADDKFQSSSMGYFSDFVQKAGVIALGLVIGVMIGSILKKLIFIAYSYYL